MGLVHLESRVASAEEPERGPGYLRALYEGHRGTTIGAVKSRFIGGAVNASGNAYGYDESFRNILVENELRPLIDERIEAVPRDFEFAKDEAAAAGKDLATKANAWARGKVSPEGYDLYTVYDRLRRDQEIDGATAVVMGRHPNGRVWAGARDTCGARSEKADPDNPLEVTAWTFSWTEAVSPGPGEPVTQAKFEERFDANTRTLTRDGHQVEFEEHLLGFLPVVLIPRRHVTGSPLGDSGVGELEEAYLNFLWASFQRNSANKYTAFQVWVPEDDMTAAVIQGVGNTSGPTQHNVAPGAILKLRLKPAGGNVNLASIEAQRKDSLDNLRRLGRGERDNQAAADDRSAKSMVVQKQGLARYADAKLVFLRLGLAQIATLWARLAGEIGADDEASLVAIFSDGQDPDPGEQRERAKLWLEAYKAGACTLVVMLREWVRLGVLDEDTDVDQMAADIQELQAAEAEDKMTRMAAALEQRKPGPQAPPEDENKGPAND